MSIKNAAEPTSRNKSCSVVTARLAEGSGASDSARVSPAAANARPTCAAAILQCLLSSSTHVYRLCALFGCALSRLSKDTKFNRGSIEGPHISGNTLFSTEKGLACLATVVQHLPLSLATLAASLKFALCALLWQ